jgi:hypothetical protein
MASIIPNSTTLLKSVGPSDTFIPLSSVANINKGDVIYVDSEAMPTSRTAAPVTGAIPGVFVVRTGRAASHGVGATVYTGPPSSFSTVDPVGVPPAGSQAWVINVITGRIWVAQGDEAGPGSANRFWQLQTLTPGIGALGVRTSVASPQ